MYDYVLEFYEGLARVELNGKYGLVDKTGKQVIPCNYDNAYFSDDLINVSFGEGENARYGLFDKTGKTIIPCYCDTINNFRLLLV